MEVRQFRQRKNICYKVLEVIIQEQRDSNQVQRPDQRAIYSCSVEYIIIQKHLMEY